MAVPLMSMLQGSLFCVPKLYGWSFGISTCRYRLFSAVVIRNFCVVSTSVNGSPAATISHAVKREAVLDVLDQSRKGVVCEDAQRPEVEAAIFQELELEVLVRREARLLEGVAKEPTSLS